MGTSYQIEDEGGDWRIRRRIKYSDYGGLWRYCLGAVMTNHDRVSVDAAIKERFGQFVKARFYLEKQKITYSAEDFLVKVRATALEINAFEAAICNCPPLQDIKYNGVEGKNGI